VHNKKILAIDDDLHILKIIEGLFSQAGAQVHSASNGKQGLRTFYSQRPDLVILDIMMPEMDGFEICRQIRQLADTPIIMLTALNSDEEMIRGLDNGADDFVTKPFNKEVLLARARAVFRRVEQAQIQGIPISYQDDYLTIDLAAHKVLVNGEQVKLTPTEFRLLAYLAQNAGRVCTFQNILENVWGWEYRDSPDYVHVYVSHIRGKIERDPKRPQYICTEHGVGYRFEK
jgi:DNA-binding response OmpR family regulator